MEKIGIGYENYKRMVEDGCYYVDKTMLIKDIIEMGGMVTLFTRPRRFGKTLALSMLRTLPLENAYYKKFYQKMVGFIRSLFESALKTNDALAFGVVTGCLPLGILKFARQTSHGSQSETLFTGLNHLKINSILDDGFSEGFGFTPAETEQMLRDYGIADRIPEAKEWYNGYIFGETEIYNPWSVINYVSAITIDKRKFLNKKITLI